MTEETINPIKWTIHDTHPDRVQLLREKLKEVVDPEIGMDIIQLGLIRDVAEHRDFDERPAAKEPLLPDRRGALAPACRRIAGVSISRTIGPLEI